MRLAEHAAPAVAACCRKRRRVKEVMAVSSSVYSRRPDLHGCGGAVGPGIVRDERQGGRMLLGSFRPVAEVQPGTRRGLFVNSPGALQSYDTAQRVIAKLRPNGAGDFWIYSEAAIGQCTSFRLAVWL